MLPRYCTFSGTFPLRPPLDLRLNATNLGKLKGTIALNEILSLFVIRYLGSMTPEIFRQRYPQGGLISELAAIEHGQFIVRVVVELEGRQLASGLAAAPSVEQAEDQARIRALNLLGTVMISSSDKPKQAAAPPPERPAPEKTMTAPFIESSPIATAATPATKTAPVPNPAPVAQAPETLPLQIEAMVINSPPKVEPELPPTPVALDPEEALDFSEIIARSDVELKRLGWSSEQGRTYLLETYGKRSRQLLSDEELLAFLRYLEAQPTPGS